MKYVAITSMNNNYFNHSGRAMIKSFSFRFDEEVPLYIYNEDFQSIKKLGKILLNEYMVPFEFASVLLLVAMIGTVLLSKKEKTNK